MTSSNAQNHPVDNARLPFDGVIFDMDGTLIEPLLDFSAIRADLGIPAGLDILQAIEQLPQSQRQQTYNRLLNHELSAARKARLMPQAKETLKAISQAGLRTALLTRNAAPAMRLVLDRLGLRFDLTWSREDGPIKPQPDGILLACRELGISPARTLCVGDYEYDLIAANAAGAASVLFAPNGGGSFTDLARFVIAELPQLLTLLEIK